EQDDAAAAACLVPVCELLHEQQRCANVLVQEGVKILGRQLVEPAVAATRVVDDEDVERSHGRGRRRDNLGGCGRIGEVGFDVAGRTESGEHAVDAGRVGAVRL